jgi:hypothetical protein
MRCAVLIASACFFFLSGCGTFYSSPRAGEPATVIVEMGERRKIGWYEIYAVEEIDGKPVSHMGSNLGSATVRVAPGPRNVLFSVSYRHGGDDPFDCPCRVNFPLTLDLKAGQTLKVTGSIEMTGEVTLGLRDAGTDQLVFPEQKGLARPVPKNMYLPVGNTFIPVRSLGS